MEIVAVMSDLIEKEDNLDQIKKFASMFEYRDRALTSEAEGSLKPIYGQSKDKCMFHSEMNILAQWDLQDEKILKKINDRFNLVAISFHILSRYKENTEGEDEKGKHFIGKGRPYTWDEMIANAVRNKEICRKIFGDIQILVENNNYLFSDAYDVIVDGDFITELTDNGFWLLLDFGHAMITAINKKLDPNDYIRSLPLDKCLQLHISKYSVKKVGSEDVAMDTHDNMDEQTWSVLEHVVLPFIPNVQYFTIEYYRDMEKLISQHKILNGLIVG